MRVFNKQRSDDGLQASNDDTQQEEGPVRSPWRILFTGLGGLALFWASWEYGSREMTQWSLIPGIALAGLGLFWRVWATGWLHKNETLAVQGPYAFTRNPLYLGTFFLTLGQALMSGLFFAPILFPILLLVFYTPTMRREEEYLGERYGAAFEEYRRRVPILVPRLRPATLSLQPSANTFQWSRVRRCYKGFLGNILVIAIYAWLALARHM